jgi:galactose mutarotase-like enzyme
MDGRHTIQNGQLTVTASAVGAELFSIRDAAGTERLWQGDPAVWAGRAPVLFPVVGGLHGDAYELDGKRYEMGKHGFARGSLFEVEEQSAGAMAFVLRDNDETRAAYPFRFELWVRFALSENRLTVEYEVANGDTRPMPFQLGAHEAYACPGGIEGFAVAFEQPETLHRYELDGNFLSGETTPWLTNADRMPLRDADFERDAIVFLNARSDTVTLVSLADARRVDVSFPDFETLMFWTKPGAPYICIEPWCGSADFADGSAELMKRYRIQVLAPGEAFVRRHVITIR